VNEEVAIPSEHQWSQADFMRPTKEVADLQEQIKKKHYMEFCTQFRRKSGFEVDQRESKANMQRLSEGI
jgi:hypothetical protein